MHRKTRAHRTPSASSGSPSRSRLFWSEKNRELFERLNSKRNIWAQRFVVLDEIDPAIRANFESRGWLPLLEIDHPPLTALIREFYSNLSIHIYDSDTLVKSWIWGVEFVITPRVVADALRVLVVRQPVYPYEESPPLDDVMSYITGSFIQWGFDPRITFAELTETSYLFFWIACHSLWLISHLHTIPLEWCVFLYALVSSAPISFPHLFLRSLNEVHGSSAIGHALFHPIFIHRILLFLSLDDFPAGEPVHVVAHIGATFLRQRAAHLRVGSSHPKAVPSSSVPPPSTSTGTNQVEASGGAAATNVDVLPPTTSDDSDIRRTLDHVLTIQVAHRQILVDMLDEIHALRAELTHFRRPPSPPPFDDGFWLPFGILSQKRGSSILSLLVEEILILGGDFYCFGAWGVLDLCI